jgi:hypothetical protein
LKSSNLQTADAIMDNRCSPRRRSSQRRTLILLPLNLPRLTDQAAAQLVEVLHELAAGIEHIYATPIARYHRRQRQLHQARPSPPPPAPDDPPF